MKFAAFLLPVLLSVTSACLADSPLELRRVVSPGTPGAVKKVWGDGPGQEQIIYCAKEVLLDARSVAEASVVAVTARESAWHVEVKMTDTGRAILAEATTRHSGERLAILAEGRVIVVATVTSPITGGVLRISGNLTEEEAKSLAATLNAKGSGGR